MLTLIEALIDFFSRNRFRISLFGFPIWSARSALGTVSFGFIATTFLVGAAFAAEVPTGVTNIFKPLSTPAQAIHEVSLLVLAICAGIFLVVGALLVYTVVRFRRRPGDESREPPQIYGSNQLEFAWTVIPIVIVFVLFLATARTIYDVQGAQPPAGAVNV
ncbi:MAG: cytochrome c oxidase subunit II transmembrane domain-containing protein, partial [Candidatus Binatia bacterium]